MKTFVMITLAGAVTLAATGDLEAQERRGEDRSDRISETRDEPRSSGLARIAARMLGASEEEAEAAALLLPAVQSAREVARPAAQPQAGNVPCSGGRHCDWLPIESTSATAGGQGSETFVLAAADVNGDGMVSEADCMLALRHPEAVDPQAVPAFIKIKDIQGESTDGAPSVCETAAHRVLQLASLRR